MKRSQYLLLAFLAIPLPGARIIDHEHDDPAHLNASMELNLQRIDSMSKRSVPNVAAPWSDITWKANKGLLTERYWDPNFTALEGLRAKQDYLKSNSLARILALPRGEEKNRWIAALSPAEKYDILTGIAGDGLTEEMSKFLADSLGSDPEFPSWWGLCEGSAPASMVYNEPTKTVTLMSTTYGVDVPFFPSDIKALATLLWSRFNTNLYLPEAGLPCSKDGGGCADTNPGSFHAALHNFLDLSPGVLVADVDPTPTVWNFPVISYSETYFNPKAPKAQAASLESASIRKSEWAQDPRARKRSPGTAYIVGVKMTFSYAMNQHEVHRIGSVKRQIKSRTISYELELDKNWTIIGGEWLSGNHPDLLWTIPPGTIPNTPGDLQLPSDGGTLTPAQLAAAAKKSSTDLLPLRRVVEALVRKSSN